MHHMDVSIPGNHLSTRGGQAGQPGVSSPATARVTITREVTPSVCPMFDAPEKIKDLYDPSEIELRPHNVR